MSSINQGSVTRLVEEAKCNEPEAMQKLFERYWDSLLRVARQHLNRRITKDFDEEDVALSVFQSFFHGANSGRFPQLADRHDLWRILLLLAKRKSASYARSALALKRGIATDGGVLNEIRSLDDLISREPAPDFVALAADLCNTLLDALPDDGLRIIATLKLEGMSAKEIASRLKCTVRTVERKIERIQRQWMAYLELST